MPIVIKLSLLLSSAAKMRLSSEIHFLGIMQVVKSPRLPTVVSDSANLCPSVATATKESSFLSRNRPLRKCRASWYPIEKLVLLRRSVNLSASMLNSFVSPASDIGKSDAGSVATLNLLLPPLIITAVSRNSSVVNSDSSDFKMSANFLEGIVDETSESMSMLHV